MALKTYATHFASIGGACWGLEQAGLRCVHAIEREAIRVEYRHKNIGHLATCMDISDYKPSPKDAADVLWTSPPCQRLSSLSRADADDQPRLEGGHDVPMNYLYLKSVKYCEVCRPKYFILENVMGILTHKNDEGKFTKALWQRDFEELGYVCEWNVLNSKFFGVPQDRERVFLVGSLDGKQGLIPWESSDVSKTIMDVMEPGSIKQCWEPHTYCTVLESIADNSAKNNTPYRFTLVGPKATCGRGTKKKVSNIFPTITCGWGGGATRKKVGVLDHANGINFLRHPTVREGARAQGFPDSWVFPESDSVAWGMIGDAVTSPVAMALAKHVMALDAGERPAFKREKWAKRMPSYAHDMDNQIEEIKCETETITGD